MQIEVYGTYQESTELKLRERSVVVIDLLRATTTMVTALDNGAKNVFPVCDVEEAINLYRVHKETSLLAGEREGLPIEGFQLGNSPQAFTREIVQDKTIVLTTSNGTMALHAVRNSEVVLLACLRNRKVIVKRLIELENDISIICAGTDGRFSADDFYCAGAIVDQICTERSEVKLADDAQVAQVYYQAAKQSSTLIQKTKHYQKMESLKLESDLAFCFEEDVCDCVPTMVNSIVERS